MVLGNDNRDQSSEKQLEAGQALEIDHENELGYNKVCILLRLLLDGM